MFVKTWADAFRGEPELKEFVVVYEELKEKGCEFPMTDLDNIPPIHTPARVTNSCVYYCVKKVPFHKTVQGCYE